MKFIPTSNIVSVSATAADATYIDDWVLETNKPKKVWKAVTGVAGLWLEVSAGDCVALYNHNCDTVNVYIYNYAKTAIIDGPYNNDLSSYSYGNDRLWQEYDPQSSPFYIYISFQAARTIPAYCGVAWAGNMVEFTNPDKELSLGYEDYSIDYIMSSRSTRQVEKDIKKKFTSNSLLTLEDDWFDVMQSIKNYVGYSTVPWLIMDDQFITHNILGYISDFSLGAHNYAFKSNLPLEVVER